MNALHIAVFAVAAVPFMLFVPTRWRSSALLAGTLLAIIWLLADDGVTDADSVLLAGTLGMVLLVWWVVQPAPTDDDSEAETAQSQVIPALFVAGIGLVWLASAGVIEGVTAGFAVAGGGAVGIAAVGLPRIVPRSDASTARRTAAALIALIVVLLVILKYPSLADYAGFSLSWDALSLAEASPFIWLGFSYIAFRLIAALLDFRAGRLKVAPGLVDFTVYVLFFPAFTAGPIDRAQRFIPDLQAARGLDAVRVVEGGGRIAIGVVKKFVIADSLALIALSPTIIARTETAAGLWLLVYLYSFQIYLDFSGYSDVAIGLGRLYGINLPENFDRPYLQPNIQQFWQRWHMTLSTWFRVYFFTPFSRFLLQSRFKPPQYVMILIVQISTMALIGLWHGMTANFLVWGVWHGVGLFLFRLMADTTRGWYKRVSAHTWSRRVIYGLSVLATFHFVAIGWVFFALPNMSMSVDTIARLFGLSGI
jgi:D-alanyl-lipoteichoic acid acyltransferase DltB (MBOAT superfamily)